MNVDDLEEAKPYIQWWIDCPYCGDINDSQDIEPDQGEVVDCSGCGEKFRVASS